jgi:hypothetical protein
VPEIEIRRLRLRRLAPDYLDAYHRSVCAEAEWIRFVPGGQASIPRSPRPRIAAGGCLQPGCVPTTCF